MRASEGSYVNSRFLSLWIVLMLAELDVLSRLDSVEAETGDSVEATEGSEVGHAPGG